MITKTVKGWIIENERFYEGSDVEFFDTEQKAYKRLKKFVHWRETSGVMLDETCECGWNKYCRLSHVVMGSITNKKTCTEITRIYTKDDIIDSLSQWITMTLRHHPKRGEYELELEDDSDDEE
jgi:hypothetical protein